ncbi:hypothetical protein [Rhodococcus marinonascens]|nr:hypothetical protein [Rhodococcus marinonascens]
MKSDRPAFVESERLLELRIVFHQPPYRREERIDKTELLSPR